MNYQRNNLPSVPWWVIILGFSSLHRPESCC